MCYSLKISECEWEVMKVIWSIPNCTANEVAEKIKDIKKWNPQTVRTLISRLQNKKIIGYTQVGKMYRYYPLMDEKNCIKMESKSFLQKIYNGSPKAMIVNFIEEEYLSTEEIEELKHILGERK